MYVFIFVCLCFIYVKPQCNFFFSYLGCPAEHFVGHGDGGLWAAGQRAQPADLWQGQTAGRAGKTNTSSEREGGETEPGNRQVLFLLTL